MSKYGQYCPVARALEILGDRWTLLIVRDMLFTGAQHFNELERGLPGISRALLAARLRQLQRAGILEKQLSGSGRNTTIYQLTQAGHELIGVIGALRSWGEAWAFADPTPEELNPVLLMGWLRGMVDVNQLSNQRIAVQFDFRHGAKDRTFWLILTHADVTLCLIDPGYGIDVLVTADLVALFKLSRGRISYQEAIRDYGVQVEAAPSLIRAFPDWFGWG